jgi:serine/threonine-protein kinase
MTEAISPRLAVLLVEALDLEPDALAARLAELRRSDAVLAAGLQRLIELDARPDVPLDHAIEQAAAALQPAPEIAQHDPRYGAWRLLQRLGHGGMGSVWLAERADGGFAQRAALKLPHLDLDGAAARARFAREREVLARLTHPDIAHLLDGGIEESGQPWFAMEYVEGCTLREWLARGDVDLPARLRLLARLAHAVGFAHRHLVVHRDLKPGNVMVRGDGSPCLLDFGIARLLEADDGGPPTIQPLLTPAYAAPEQIRGEPVTTTADIYALGAILHELVTGQRLAPARASRAGPAERTGAATGPRLRGDLKAIVQRATAEEPTRRYASAEALAEDVERFLAGRTVSARPDSLRYRFGKLVRRNPLASALLAASVLAFLAAGVVAFRQAHAKAAEAERARLALRQSEAVRQFILSLLINIDPNAGSGGDVPIGALLAPARQHVIDQLSGEPAVAAELLDEIGGLYVALNRPDEARRALADALRFNARSPQPSLAIEGEARARLAHYEYMDGHGQRALAELEAVIRSLRGSADPRVRRQLAKALELAAQVRHAEGRTDAALGDEREALAILRGLRPQAETEYVGLLIGYADLCAAADQAQAALDAADAAMASPLVRDGRMPGLAAEAMGARARALQALGRYAEAEPQIAGVIAQFTRNLGADSARTYYWRYRHAQVLLSLGLLEQAQAEVDALIGHPARDDQPIAPVAYAVLGADLAARRKAPDAARRIAAARELACARPDFASFCARTRVLHTD